MLQHLAGARQRHTHGHGHHHRGRQCGVGSSLEECERVHTDASIPPLFRRTPELAHWYDHRRQRLAHLHAFRSTPHMGKLAVTALYAWIVLCYYALLRTVLLPVGPAWPPLLGPVFVGFTLLLALVLYLHVLLLRSSPGFVPTSWMPAVGLATASMGDKQQWEVRETVFPARDEAGAVVEVVVVQAPRQQHDPVGGGGGDREVSAAHDVDDEDDRAWKDYCVKCSSMRPPRARHCRVCNRCVLKMDHHCPWVNNCVGNNNFKLFFLFLCAASLLGVSSCSLFLLGGLHFWRQWDDMPPDVFWSEGALLFVNWWLSMAATAHIAMMTGHMYVNMTENATTIEQITLGTRRSLRKNPYDLGREENMRQVMGDGAWQRWLRPLTPPATDGFSFPTRTGQ